MRIGFFDSGVGGITVLKEALKILPKEDFLYYADVDNVPYGPKTKEQVKQYVFNAVEFMIQQKIKALVVACNTATSISIKDLREKYSIPILGMEPAVKPAVERSNGKRVLVFATELTLKEDKYHNLVTTIDSNNIVDELALPGLVLYAENFVFDEKIIEDYLREQLKDFHLEQYGTIVLGCTHFPFYKSVFKRIFEEDTDIIDGNLGTIRHLKNILEQKKLLSNNGNGDIIYFSSGREEPDGGKYKKYLERAHP